MKALITEMWVLWSLGAGLVLVGIVWGGVLMGVRPAGPRAHSHALPLKRQLPYTDMLCVREVRFSVGRAP
jgi:hypothetical protein